MKKKRPGTYLQITGVICVLVYMIIPALKIMGVLSADLSGETTNSIFTVLLIAGVVLYLAGRGQNARAEEEEEARGDDTEKSVDS